MIDHEERTIKCCKFQYLTDYEKSLWKQSVLCLEMFIHHSMPLSHYAHKSYNKFNIILEDLLKSNRSNEENCFWSLQLHLKYFIITDFCCTLQCEFLLVPRQLSYQLWNQRTFIGPTTNLTESTVKKSHPFFQGSDC